MKRIRQKEREREGRKEKEERMDPEAYAGFLRLWITPPSRDLRPSPEVEAYLRYLAEKSPLSPVARRALNQKKIDQAA